MKTLFSAVTITIAVILTIGPATSGDESSSSLTIDSAIPPSAEADGKSHSLSGFSSSRADSTHSYDVLFYELRLYFPMTAEYLEGSCLIRCRSEETSLSSISLHLVDLSADSVLVDGSAPLSWNHAGGILTVDFTSSYAEDDTFEVEVFYGGYPTSGYSTTGSGAFLTGYTVTEPSDSRHWFPCWDEPWDKADQGCALHAEVPLGYVVASNGLLTDVDTTTDSTVTYRWREDYPITTYLMSVAIAQYAQILDEYVTAADDTIEVRHFVYPPDSSSAVNRFADTPDMMGYFASIFGEYPFEKYGMACVTNFWGGMEHQTMTTILRSAATSGWESGVAHELAHMWWGDMVTCFIWPEIWINEGFATYSEAMWYEHKYGFETFRAKITSYGNDYLTGSYTQFPLYDPPQLFTWDHVYTKGAWVLHMLRRIVGDSNYSSILRAFGEKFKYGNATTEDFRGVVDSVMSDTFDYYFQQWIYSPGHPEYEYGWQVREFGGQNYALDIQIRQTQSHGPFFSMPVDLRLNYAGGDTLVTVWARAEEFQEISVPLLLPEGATGFTLTFDPDNWLLEEHDPISYVVLNVVSTIPAQNELDVSEASNLSITFDLNMDPTTINDSTYLAFGRASGPHQGLVNYYGGTRTATLDPAVDFAVGEVIDVVLTEDVRASWGVSLRNGYHHSFTARAGDGPGTFVFDSVYATGTAPQSVTAVDLDGDSQVDLAVANTETNDISVLLNKGDSTFADHITYETAGAPLSVFSSDFDCDGWMDLAACCQSPPNLTVLVNDGDGTFSTDSVYSLSDSPSSVTGADFDGDGTVDLAVSSEASGNVSILLNSGDGTFASAASYSVAASVLALAVGDLDNDGDYDLAIVDPLSSGLALLLNNGDGTFAPGSTYTSAGDAPQGVAVGDFDGDAHLDLAVADSESDTLALFLGNGDGTFLAPVLYDAGNHPVGVLSADLDGDGDLDLAVSNDSQSLTILLNTGTGILSLPSTYVHPGQGSYAICGADFDFDGDIDVALANRYSADVSLILNEEPALDLFIRGDTDGNMDVEMADAIYGLQWLYVPGTPDPGCLDAFDSDDNAELIMSDPLYVLRYLYVPGAPPPPGPFPLCGPDPTEDDTLNCSLHPCMETTRTGSR